MSTSKNTDSQDFIGDVGEKFVGAKKDNQNTANFDDFKNLYSSEFTKRNLWKRPDFRGDVNSGLNTAKHAILFMAVYDNLLSKPPENRVLMVSYETWEQAYKASIEFLKACYEYKHYECVKKLQEDFDTQIRRVFPDSLQDLERYAAGKETTRKLIHPISLKLEGKLRQTSLMHLGWLEDEDVLDTDSFGAYQLIDPQTNRKWWYAVKSNTPKSLTLLDKAKFEKFDEAMQLAKEIFDKEILIPRKLAKQTQTPKSKPPKRPFLDRAYIRQGPNYRKDQPITVDEFMKTFRFRGIEFGNWVTQTERQGFLDATYDAFMDLARIFGLPPSFASLGGTLGIAFGSRGKGADNVAAHFEPDQWLIHLTKTKGVGSLCHEFAHALDAYIAKRNNTKANFLTETFVHCFKGYRCFTRNELYHAPTMKDKGMMPEFTTLLHTMLFKYADRVSNTHSQFKDADRESNSHSQFTKNALSLDAQSNKVYWADPAELFARAFETWMSDRLVKDGQLNEFLVYGTDQSPSSWNTKMNMYPEGREREQIVKAMDSWATALVKTWTQK